MITALDSSVILDVLTADRRWCARSLGALKLARAEGQLVVSDVVIAEISPALGDGEVDDLLDDWQICHVPCSLPAAIHAGERFRAYLGRGGKRGRVVPDFLIAAHAQFHADRLLARDAGFTRDYFKDLEVLVP